MKRWILGFKESGKDVTKGFATLDELFTFVENAALPRFKVKRV